MAMRCGRHDIYRIVLKGQLGGEWSEWFAGMTVASGDNGETILTGPVADQAALHGVLIRIRDLGLPLLALTRIDLDGHGRHISTTTNEADPPGKTHR